MKLAGVAATRFFAKPEAGIAGLLIYGMDAMRVALRRQEVIAAIVGPQGEAEMRLTRMAATDLRKDPAAALDGIKARSFFPGPSVMFIDGATELQAAPILAALDAWQPGDAALIVTAGTLKATAKLRKAFESHPRAYAVGLYDDPPSREEIDAMIAAAGLRQIAPDAQRDLEALARVLDPGDFRQTVEKIGLYKLGDNTPVTPEDIANCAPVTIEAAMDDVIRATAEGRGKDIGPLIQRLAGQGVQAVALCIGATRHFRTLYAAACDPGGPATGLSRARPPVFGPRRDQMTRQAQKWGVHKLQDALKELMTADLTLRSASMAPQMAVMERTLLRLAIYANR
jgi:DNA polymerase-3 subunit delta